MVRVDVRDGGDPQDDQALDLLYAEFLLRREGGESPTLAEYRWRFPRHAARLELLFAFEEKLSAADAPTPAAPPRAGEVPGYELLAEVGRGGMCVVYRARDLTLGRTVAVKRVPAADADARARFRLEAEAAARLQHPGIVQVYEVGEAADGHPYLVLEYVAGGSLAARLAGDPLPPGPAAGLVEAVARAVHFAHQRGVLHRDLKPANILLESFEFGVSGDVRAVLHTLTEVG